MALQIDIYTTTGANTWTKPTGTSEVHVVCIGGGGGGSRRSSAYGGGGAGGGYTSSIIQASLLGSSETATVGAKGTGATSAAAGGDGAASTFGAWVKAGGGGGGASGGGGGVAGSGQFLGGVGGTGGSSNGSGTVHFAAAGGGGGNRAGGSSGTSTKPTPLAGGSAGTNNGTDATTNEPQGGAGGGGGTGSGAGGAGGKYGGGGGGGGDSNGNGGNGGDGIIIVVSFDVSGSSLNRTTSDSITYSESLARIAVEVRGPTDSLTFSESMARTFVGERSTADSLTYSESAVATRTVPRTAKEIITVTCDTPALYYAFESLLVDSSGNGKTLTNYNGVTQGTGVIGNGAVFVAASSQGLIASPVSPENYGPFSIAFWVKVSSFTSGVVVHHGGAFGEFGWRVAVNGSDRLKFNYKDGNGASTGIDPFTSALSTGVFYHVAVTFDGTTVRTYIDGTDTGVTATPSNGMDTSYVGGTEFCIGCAGSNSGTPYTPFDGVVDEVVYGRRAWSAAEVAELYNSGAGRTTPVLQLATRTFVGLRAPTDSLTFSESIARLISEVRTTADSITYSESLTGIKTKNVTATDSITYSESLARTAVEVRSTSDQITYSESLARTAVEVRSTSDSITYSESVTRTEVSVRATSDSLTYSESLARLLTGVRSTADSLTYSESLARVGQFVRNVYDGIGGNLAWYTFQSLLVDYTGRGNTLTNHGAVQVTGIRDSGADFDGSGAYMEAANNTDVSPPNSFTILFWINPGVVTAISSVCISTYDGDNAGFFIDVTKHLGDPVQVSFLIYPSWNDDPGGGFSGGNAGYLTNGWNLVAVTYDASTKDLQMSINGAAFDTVPGAFNPSGYVRSLTNLMIGGDPSLISFLDGTLDEIVISDRVWSIEEVNRFMNGELPGYLSFSDSAARTENNLRSASDQITYLESLSRQYVGARSTSDSLTYSEALTATFVGVRTTADSLTYSEALAKQLIALRTTSDQINYAESVDYIVTTGSTTRFATDSLGFSESVIAVVTNPPIVHYHVEIVSAFVAGAVEVDSHLAGAKKVDTFQAGATEAQGG